MILTVRYAVLSVLLVLGCSCSGSAVKAAGTAEAAPAAVPVSDIPTPGCEQALGTSFGLVEESYNDLDQHIRTLESLDEHDEKTGFASAVPWGGYSL